MLAGSQRWLRCRHWQSAEPGPGHARSCLLQLAGAGLCQSTSDHRHPLEAVVCCEPGESAADGWDRASGAGSAPDTASQAAGRRGLWAVIRCQDVGLLGERGSKVPNASIGQLSIEVEVALTLHLEYSRWVLLAPCWCGCARPCAGRRPPARSSAASWEGLLGARSSKVAIASSALSRAGPHAPPGVLRVSPTGDLCPTQQSSSTMQHQIAWRPRQPAQHRGGADSPPAPADVQVRATQSCSPLLMRVPCGSLGQLSTEASLAHILHLKQSR